MFERFSQEARQVVVAAQEEARLLKHNYIGTEHVLLGLLRDPETVPGQVLGSFGVTADGAREEIVLTVGPGQEISGGQIPFTPRAKKVLELSLREALSLGHNYIGPEHILLGVVREGEGVASAVLAAMGADGEMIRERTIELLGQSPPRPPSPPLAAAGSRALADAWLDGLGMSLHSLGREIRLQLGREPDAGDLLLALVSMPQTLPARAISELGIDLDELWGRIETARRERLERRAAVERKLLDMHAAMEEAIENQEFKLAAELRDSERRLRLGLREELAVPRDVLEEIRRHLGLAGPADDPP